MTSNLVILSICAGLGIAVWIIGVLAELYRRAKLYDALLPRFCQISTMEPELNRRAEQLATQQAQHEAKVKADEEAVRVLATQKASEHSLKVRADEEVIRALARQKTQGFPWLADAYADYFYLQETKAAIRLDNKSHPAHKAAQAVRHAAARRRDAERLWRTYRYQLACYENLFPWLTELREIDDDSILMAPQTPAVTDDSSDTADPATKYLTSGEYESLPAVAKFQRALDRYWASRKTNWQIGRDYERYVGYLYEKDGWDVTYFGIVKGLEDLGRDLLVQKGQLLMVIQCKRWAAHKTIHEKHIFQLFGTTIEHWIASGRHHKGVQPLLFQDAIQGNPIRPVIYTSTTLSATARDFAGTLGVEVHERVQPEPYPCIKCNYTKAHGKIYHLPFDQQYDRTKIQDPQTECFVATVKEAEERGYRRAFRWRGSK